MTDPAPAAAADVREHQFRHLDLSRTAPGEWIEIRADTEPGSLLRKNHLVACVAADDSVVYLRADDAPEEGRPHTFVLARVGRSDSLVRMAWVCSLDGEFRRARIKAGARVPVGSELKTPGLSVVAEKERLIRVPQPAVRGRVYSVNATMEAYGLELNVAAISAFSSELPFPLRTADPVLRAKAFLPASWTERSLEPASLVFLRTRQRGMNATWKVVRWGREEASLINWGKSAKARLEQA
ncbi:MAG: hypothetical protein FD180_2479 [Planctomycetota bacterium]|nr:MAG: hypothetical protein FD180_2479 [Planctomycetota bacterium]